MACAMCMLLSRQNPRLSGASSIIGWIRRFQGILETVSSLLPERLEVLHKLGVERSIVTQLSLALVFVRGANHVVD